MDPLTHTLTGASLGAAGLRRATPLAVPTLLIAANAPDVDIVSLVGGPYVSLAWRRGLTHGLPALLVLPLLVAGLVLLWDRWVRRPRRPSAAPARPPTVLALAALGVWSHPALDWLNTYGMRWLLPFDGRWSYGDAIFIVDPWLWLLLGGPAFVAWSGGRWSRAAWAALAVVLSVPVLLVEGVPWPARIAWVLGLGVWILLRWPAGRTTSPGGGGGARIARTSLAVAMVYVLVMVFQTRLAEDIAVREATVDPSIGTPTTVMVGPAPANPFAGQIVMGTEEAYWTGAFRWGPEPRVRWHPQPFRRLERNALIEAAEAHPEARRWLVWARFPFHEIEARPDGWEVTIRDARYAAVGGGLGGIRVLLDADMQAVAAHPPPARTAPDP